MKNRYTGLKLGFVGIVLAGAIFSTLQVFAQENPLEGVARELVLDEKYIIFPVADETNEDDSEVQVLELEVDGEKVTQYYPPLRGGIPHRSQAGHDPGDRTGAYAGATRCRR